MAKVRVAVFCGGRSPEHDVSIVTGIQVLRAIDRERYEPFLVYVSISGEWFVGDKLTEHATYLPNAQIREQLTAVDLQAGGTLQPRGGGGGLFGKKRAAISFDVAMQAFHGLVGEDGGFQGTMEMAGIPYTGMRLLGSAVAMDKAVMKMLFAVHGLPMVRHLTVVRREWEHDPQAIAARAARELGYPMFVKPANLGSSVGISRATTEVALHDAVRLAFEFDRKIVIEAAVPEAREIECAVLGNDLADASVPGEIIVTHRDGFYSYDAKYVDADGASWRIPADIPADITAEVQRLSVVAFHALELSGMARVDFFIERGTGALFVNEVNTIPGFTTISMYPKMWEASGIPYPALLDRLIALALERHSEKQLLRTSIT